MPRYVYVTWVRGFRIRDIPEIDSGYEYVTLRKSPMLKRKRITDCFANLCYVTGIGIYSDALRKYLNSRYVTYTGMRLFSGPAIQHPIRRFWRFKPAWISLVSVYVYECAKLTGKGDFFRVPLSCFVSIGVGEMVFRFLARRLLKDGRQKGMLSGSLF